MLILPTSASAVVELELTKDVAPFTRVGEIALEETIIVPTPVQVELPEDFNTSYEVAVVTSGTSSELVHSEYVRNTTTMLVPISVVGVNGALTDGNTATAVDFPVEEGMPMSTTLQILANEPVFVSGVTFNLAQYGVMPETVSITAEDAQGKSTVVVATTKVQGSVISFPNRKSISWTVTFNHTQPLKLTELGVRQSSPKQVQNTEVQFLAVPNTAYTIYFNPEVRANLPRVESPQFTVGRKTVAASIVSVSDNTYYVAQDTDDDTIPNKTDNCPAVANPDQADIDASGEGDACEDFDRDGVMNPVDNCPDTPNRAQTNKDADEYGDECDESDDRFTEQNPLVPWAGLILAGAAIAMMFLQVRQQVAAAPKEAETEGGE